MTVNLFELPEDDNDSVNIDNALEALVGEGKKFKTVEDLAKGKVQSDAFIKQLIAEKKAAVEELNRRASLEDMMTELKKSNAKVPPNSDNTGQTSVNAPAPDAPKTLTIEDVNRLLADKDKANREANNLSFVASTLSAKFGPQFQSVVNDKIRELGLTTQYMETLAKELPNAFLNIIGEPATESRGLNLDAFVPKSSVNSSAFSGGANGGKSPKKFSDFEKIRKEDPRRYATSAVQDEMFKLTAQYGDDFLKS